jgi:hypothetical protein
MAWLRFVDFASKLNWASSFDPTSTRYRSKMISSYNPLDAPYYPDEYA